MARNPTWNGTGSKVYINYGVDDGYNVKVSTDDTTPDFLDQKIVAGTDITISTLNPGGDEQLQISVSAGAAGFDGYTVKATVTDTTPDFIDQKLIPVGLMTITQQNAGADEYLEIGVDLDGYLTYTKIDGYAKLTDLNSYALRSSLDAYLTFTEIDGYAKTSYVDSQDDTKLDKTTADAYLTYLEIDGYALTSYVDSQDDTKLDKTTADAYLTYLEIDGYALKTYVDSQDDLKLDKTTADAYLTYLEIDGYALKTYVDSQDDTKANLTLLDGYLELDGSDAMTGNLDMGANDITNVGNVDGYDLPAQFQSIANDDAYQDAQLTDINTDVNNHLADTANPHATDIENLGSGTLAELNDAITDADLVSEASFNNHSARHESGGADAIKLDDFAEPDDNTDLNASSSAHGLLPKLSDVATEFLNGQGGWATPTGDNKILVSSNDSTSGYLENKIVGDGLVSISTLNDGGDEDVQVSVDLDGYADTSHASTHITGGSDEVDGDKLDIDWNPTNYTPATTPAEADSADNLTAHLYGIDQGMKVCRGVHTSTSTKTMTLTTSGTWYTYSHSGYDLYEKNITITNTTGQITVDHDGDYLVSYAFSVTAGADGGEFIFALAVNGTRVHHEQRIAGSTTSQHFSATFLAAGVSATDTLDLIVGRDVSASTTCNIIRLGLTVWRIGE